jgi:hypothetical protein
MKVKEPKKPGGIALRPALWKRIDVQAERLGKTRNEYMEAVLDTNVPAAPDFTNAHEKSIVPEWLEK